MRELLKEGLRFRKMLVGVAVREDMPVKDHIEIVLGSETDASVQDLTETVLFSCSLSAPPGFLCIEGKADHIDVPSLPEFPESLAADILRVPLQTVSADT